MLSTITAAMIPDLAADTATVCRSGAPGEIVA
jgi:hypothetical protein